MGNEQTSQRVNVVDVLRGFAVCGIIIIHFLEHLNFYMFPEQSRLDTAVWDTVFFLGSNKMYAIFALLFGFSCYIQHHNREKKGLDFRPRFAWRMLLLFLWGMADLLFFNGDILCTYAVLGLFLIPLVKAPDKVLFWVAFFLFLQPVELVYMVLGFVNPSMAPMDLGIGPLWGVMTDACANGSILDVASTGHRLGLQLNFGWALENGRLTQTLFLFVLGMLLGRRRLFLDEGSNLDFWKNVLAVSISSFAVLQVAYMFVPEAVSNAAASNSLGILLKAWRNFAMMSFYVSGIVLLYYKTRAYVALGKLACIGKMSLTCYLLQSIIGGLLFYGWGLAFYKWSVHSISFCLSLVFLVLLYFFCKWWTAHHRRGHLEELWSRATFIGARQ